MTRRLLPVVGAAAGLAWVGCSDPVSPQVNEDTVEVWFQEWPTRFGEITEPRISGGKGEIGVWGSIFGSCGAITPSVETDGAALILVVHIVQLETLKACQRHYEAVLAPLPAGQYEFHVRHRGSGNGSFDRLLFHGTVRVE